MDREAIFTILLEYINEYAGREYEPGDIDRSRPPVDYGVDSLNVLQVLTEIENALGVEIDLAEISASDFATIDAILDYLLALRTAVDGQGGSTA